MGRSRTVVVLLTAGLAVSWAEAQSGGLEVIVTDEQHEPLPGAVVTISHPQGYVGQSSVQTRLKGNALFPVLRPTGVTGIGYVVTITFPGFASQRLADIKVRIGQVTRLPVQLSQEIVVRVEVKGSADVVDLDDTSQSTKFSDEFVRDLPVPGHAYENMLTLAPGVQDADGDGNPNVHGSRDRDFKAVVSNVSNVDPLTGRQMFEVNPDSIEEIEVVSSGASLEFRRAQGGFARILQKQGSNDFEGVFELLFRSGTLDGNGAHDSSAIEDPDFTSYQPSVQFSGPIVKDKLWYRLSHELVHLENPIVVPTGIVIETTEQTINADQLTWQVSPRNKLAFQFQSDPLTETNLGVTSFVPPESSILYETSGETYGLTWTAPYSPQILIESNVAWQDQNIHYGPTDPNAGVQCLVGPVFLRNAYCRDLDTGTVSGPFFQTFDDHRQRFAVQGSATVFAGSFLGATHLLKTGLSIENERYFRHLTQRPAVDLQVVTFNDAGGGAQTPERHATIGGSFPVPSTSQVRSTGVTWGLYAEDQMKPRSNVTLTLGFGVDREEIEAAGNGTFSPEAEYQAYLDLLAAGVDDNAAFQRPFTGYENLEDFYKQLAQQLAVPFEALFSRQTTGAQNSTFWDRKRIADNIRIINTNPQPYATVAWDPWSNGKTSIGASYRRYYGILPLALPLTELNPPTATVSFDAEPDPQTGAWRINPGASGLRRSVSPAVNVRALARDIESPHNDEVAVFFQREIARETAMTLRYIRRRYRDQLQDIDLNHVPLDAGRCNATTQAPGDRFPVVPVGPSDPGYDPALAPGDGVIDDCAGELEFVPNAPGTSDDDINLEHPDGIPDLYVQNPGWGNVLYVGNFNSIDYDAYSLELTRRQYRNWELRASYTWSKSIGDGEDFNQALGNDRTLIEDERGYQSTDQRHVVKVAATTVTPWGVRIGGSMTWQSGLPYSLLWEQTSYDAISPVFQGLTAEGAARPRTTYQNGLRNTERNVAWWDFNAKVTKEFRLGHGLNGQASVEVYNLLNDGTYQVYNPFTGTGQQRNGNNESTERFGRRWQLGLRLAF
jgi:hypothetical protein